MSDLTKLQAVAQEAANQAKASGDMSAIGLSTDILNNVNKPLNDLIVKTATDRVNSIKAFQGVNAKSIAQIEAILRNSAYKVAATGDVNSLVSLMNLMTTEEVKGFRKQIDNNVKIAQAALDNQKRVTAAAMALAQAQYEIQFWLGNQVSSLQGVLDGAFGAQGFSGGPDAGKPAPGVSVPGKAPSTPAQVKAQKDLQARQTALDTLKKQLGTWDEAMGQSAPSGSATKAATASGPTAAQIEEARLGAQATPGDPLSAALAALNVAKYKMQNPKDQVEYWNAVKGLKDAQYAYAQAQQSIVEARISAGGIAGDPISQASVALRIAEYKVRNAVGGAAYWSAVKGLRDAQYALAQAEMQNANDAAMLRIDMTNPVAMARAKVAEAQRLLNFDRHRGASGDIAKDTVALQQARSSAEKAAFDQQFGDMQTNYNLQRISLSAYLSYLNAQHNYLTHVHNKTRQQVDELNQVDQALKGLADQMQGQFNLGQIKLPSAYEARRITALAPGQETNVQITINGADIAAVKDVLAQYVGPGVMATASSTVRKV